MQHPLGEVKKNVFSIEKQLKKEEIIIAVGDIVSLSLLELNITPAVSIIDRRTRRHALSEKEKSVLLHSSKNVQVFNNRPGTIHTRTVNGFRKLIKKFLATNQS